MEWSKQVVMFGRVVVEVGDGREVVVESATTQHIGSSTAIVADCFHSMGST